MICIKEIPFQDTFFVRHIVLRQGKPIESCFFDGDDFVSTKHFGLYVNKKITGVVSVYLNRNTTFNSSKQFQIRGMAVLKDVQNLGYGKQLMKHCETYISGQNGTLVWFNARINAVPFYEKLDYLTSGTPFEIQDVGLHYLMCKKIG